MLISENILLALAGLKANLMRSLLTMLGIIIGISSVIGIMTVGNSIKAMVNSKMQGMGANTITIGITTKSDEEETTDSGLHFGPGKRKEMTEDDYLSEDMIKDFRSEFDGQIKYTLLSESVGSGQSKKGTLYANVNVLGYNKSYINFTDLDILGGRSFIDIDYDDAKKVCLVSDFFVNNMFDGDIKRAVGSPIEVYIGDNFYTYHIVGVYKYDPKSEFSFTSDKDRQTNLYLPLKTAREQAHRVGKGYQSFSVVGQVDVNPQELSKDIENFFNIKYYFRNTSYEVMATSMASMMDALDDMLGKIEIALSVIAGISLLVGGIGVMNIMLVSITERTKEIGTRKALGATNGSIRLQFITESVVICVVGGIIGIIVGVLFGTVAVKVMGYDTSVSVSSVIIAVAFSTGIGVFFGYYPANKAAKLNPIDALRYE